VHVIYEVLVNDAFRVRSGNTIGRVLLADSSLCAVCNQWCAQLCDTKQVQQGINIGYASAMAVINQQQVAALSYCGTFVITHQAGHWILVSCSLHGAYESLRLDD
jgi:hypothetical protein